MGFSITVSRCDVDNCPHCGKPIRGTIRDYEYSGGRVWKEYLKKIGYYVPYEIREKEPERDFYGKDMLESVEDSLEKYEQESQTWDLKKEDSVESVYRRLKQARQEILVVSKDFENPGRLKYLSDHIEKYEV